MRSISTYRRALFLVAFFCCCLSVDGSQQKNIERVIPRLGQSGTTVDVEIQGISLYKPREVIFFKPGIRAFDLKMSKEQPKRRGMAHGAFIDCAISCKFEIARDCPPGVYPFRVLTATELTCFGTFHVTPFRVIAESSAANDSLDTAMDVGMRTTVLGKIGYEPTDIYRVPVQAGRQLAVEVDSVRICDVHYGGSNFDLAVRILDGDGKELAQNDDNPLHIQDPVVTLVPDYDGYAFVEVSRSVYVHNKTSYAVHIGDNRRPTVAFPPGARAGSKQEFRMLGDALGEFNVELDVPSSRGSFEYFGDAASAVTLRSSPYDNFIEDTAREVNTVPSLPIAINGVIDSRGDTDSFRLSVEKDKSLRVRVYASTLGSPIDAKIRVHRIIDGKRSDAPEVQADDARLPDRDIFGTSYRAGGGRKDILDPSVVWTPKESGDYVLELSDSSGAGGPTGVYRIEIEALRTVVQTTLRSRMNDWAESTGGTGLAVARGNRRSINVTISPGQWKSPQGEYELVARGLPDGVRMFAPRVKPGTSVIPIELVADPTAKTSGAVITFEARSVNSDERIETRSQQNVPFINHPGGDALHAIRVDRYIMGVTEEAPFTLEIDKPEAPLVRGGELAIPVRITRRKGLNEPVEFVVGFIPRGIDAQARTIIPAGETTGTLHLSASPSAPLGTTPFVVIGNNINDQTWVGMGPGHIFVSSGIVDLNVIQPIVELAAEASSIRRGETKPFVWSVKENSEFDGEATVKLLGLPKGVAVVAPLPRLTSGTKEVRFLLEATGEALLGQVNGLSCELTILVKNQSITQRTGNGRLRIDPKASE